MIHLQKDKLGKLRQQISISSHQIYADTTEELGGDDSAPGPHDIFDSALAACKAITLTIYAQRKGIPLESVNIDIERDSTKEKQGEYILDVNLQLLGNLTQEQRLQLLAVANKCPIHKLMTQTNVTVNTHLINDGPLMV